MKVTTVMGNAAIQKAVANGLIPDGVTIEQRQKLDEVLQAALDAHPVLKMASGVVFAGADISRLTEVCADEANAVLTNTNVKIVFRPEATLGKQ